MRSGKLAGESSDMGRFSFPFGPSQQGGTTSCLLYPTGAAFSGLPQPSPTVLAYLSGSAFLATFLTLRKLAGFNSTSALGPRLEDSISFYFRRLLPLGFTLSS